MKKPKAPPPDAPGAAAVPASLRRRGLRRVELSDGRGRCAAIRRGSVLLFEGERLRVRVVLRRAVPPDLPPTVKVEGGRSLRVVQRPCPVQEKDAVVVQAEFRGRLRSTLPAALRPWVPWAMTSGDLDIVLTGNDSRPLVLTIPVRVRPRVSGVAWRIGTAVAGVSLLPALALHRSGHPTEPLDAILIRAAACAAAGASIACGMLAGRVVLWDG